MSFIVERRYETVTYDLDEPEGWAGFQVRLLVNPTGSENHYAGKLWRAYIEAIRTPNPDADAFAIESEFWQHIAPRIIEWNYERRQPDGSTVVYPPPAENWEVVRELEPAVILWLAMQVMVAHLPKPKAQTPSAIDAGPMDTTPPIKMRPRNSSRRSGSTLSA